MEVRRKYLTNILNKIEGTCAIIIMDREGVPVLKVMAENCPDLATRPNFLATFGMATDQAGKMGAGKNKRIVCAYTNYQVVHFNMMPLLVTIIASSTANTGLLLGLESELDSIIQDVKVAVAET